jgi:hypothetical protein
MSATGLRARLDEELREDREFLRKLKPSLVAARARGELPRGGTVPRRPARPRPSSPSAGPNPFLVVGAAFVVGIALARFIDWRSHGHPRG